MRVSSGMIFDAGVSAINKQTATLLHLQQQVSLGRRMITPSDDPVAAARALEVIQSESVIAQFKENHANATTSLGLEEAQLSSTSELLARVRELTIQAGNTNLSDTGRRGIATELRARFNELMGIANAKDANGQHMFAGYMGSTTPFGGNVDNLLAGNEITYQGDDGVRRLQVSPSRFMEVSDSGNDLFKRIRNGNGTFVTAYAAGNAGTGVVSNGSVTDPAAWRTSATKNVAVNLTVTAGVTTYDLVDTSTGISLLTGGAGPAPLANQRTYLSGQPIVLKSQGAEPAFDLGSSVVINGVPANGDSFSLAPSTTQSVFKTIANLVGALEAGAATPGANAKYINDLGFAVANLDQASENLLRTRASIGSRQSEIQSLGGLNDDLSFQYQKTLSELQDLDYAKAISDLTRKQTDLEAAQQSFVRVSQLSLFNYL